MKPPAPHIDLQLRVLAGPQAGARADLPARSEFELRVGDTEQPPAQDGDLLLRAAPGQAPLRLRLRVGRVRVSATLLDGQARLAGVDLAPGQETDWPLRAELQAGELLLGVGPAAEEPWLQLHAHGAGGQAGEPGPAQAAHPGARPGSSAARRAPERWLAGVGAALALGSAALLGLAQVADRPAAPPAAQAQAALAHQLSDSEFRQLQLARSADGRLQLNGRLATLAQRARLDGFLQRQAPAGLVAVNVRVDEQLSRDVADVFRLHGVAVQVQPREDGALLVQAAETDAARLARAEQAARRDVPGLGALQLDNQPRPPVAARAPLRDDPGKRITAVVADSELPYLVTADGSRYFTGAMLPSGHRVMVILDKQVTVERDGQLTKLTL
jgi:type III secretion protein D